MARVIIDTTELRSFFEKLSQAGKGDLKAEIALWLEAMGIELLRIIEDEIIRRDVVDTRLLLHSFTKGDAANIWEIEDDGLTLEIGTHVDYAAYVNDGHWTNPKGVSMRFVPGNWNGNKFEYTPGAKTGMMLKQKWVEGKHYWESALRIFERMFPALLEAKLQEWIIRYFEE